MRKKIDDLGVVIGEMLGPSVGATSGDEAQPHARRPEGLSEAASVETVTQTDRGAGGDSAFSHTSMFSASARHDH